MPETNMKSDDTEREESPREIVTVESNPPVVVLEPENAAPQPTVTRVVIRRSSAPWAVAAVFFAFIVCATIVVYSVLYRLPRAVVEEGAGTVNTTVEQIGALPERLAGALRPQVNIETIVSTAIGPLREEGKLVVMTTEVNVEVAKTSEKRILWDYLDLGDTTTRLRVRENRVQYYIPIDRLTIDNMEFDPVENCLVLRVPEPILDTELVDVQSDPGKMDVETDVGWARLQSFSGEYVENEARRELRGAVINEGRNPLLIDRARKEAEAAVLELFEVVKPALKDGVLFRVALDAPAPSAAETPPAT
jgi:hypothetical protein